MIFTCRSDKEPIEFRHLECDDISEATVQMQTVPFREVGPSFSMVLRRNKMAATDLFKEACRQPKVRNPDKKRQDKNKFTTNMGETRGKVFIQQQDIETIALRKFKNVGRRAPKDGAAAAETAANAKSGEEKLQAEDV